jgi:hypothetical protein
MPDPGRDRLAEAGRGDYLGPMSVFPRPAGPRALWADLKLFWSTRTRVQWIAGTLAVLIPIGIAIAFYFDARTNIRPGATVIMVESWPTTRTDAEVRARQQHLAELRNRRDAERRQSFEEIDQGLNRLGI